jgi:hypothetical protein
MTPTTIADEAVLYPRPGTPGRGAGGEGPSLSKAKSAQPTAHVLLPESKLSARPFQCPNEPHPISEAVHFGRLTNGYFDCATCLHRHEVGALKPHRLTTEKAAAAPRFRSSATSSVEALMPRILKTNGVRGVAHNELSPPAARELGEQIARSLWADDGLEAPRKIRREPPVLVVGFDPRDASPRLKLELVAGLRSGGCSVIDVGRVPAGVLHFAVRHWQAIGGLYITGDGSPHFHTGFDLIGADADIWSSPGRLDALRQPSLIGRPTRQGGDLTLVDPTPGYLASWRRRLHGLRPLNILASSPDPVFAALASDLLTETPVQLQWGPASQLSDDVRRGPWDLGLTISDDGTRATFFDETGAAIPPLTLMTSLASALLEEWSHVSVVVSSELFAELGDPIVTASRGLILFHDGGVTHESLVGAMQQIGAQLGGDQSGRTWIRNDDIQCDSIAVLLQVIHWLSHRSEPVSILTRAVGRTKDSAEAAR